MKIINRKLALSLAYSAVAAALYGNAAYAEETTTQTTEQAEEQVEKITVTSRRREESIIEVPMSISTVSEMEIADRNLLTANDFFRTLAGAAAPRGQLILRGLSGGNSSAPGTTSTFVDDVPFTFTNLADVERVEVLRGPQGTLYGSNAIGGTVRIITKKPNVDDLSLFASLQSGSEQDVAGLNNSISAGLNLPLTDTMAVRISGNSEHKRRQMVNMNTGVQGKRDRNFIRTQYLYKPDDNMEVIFGYARTNYDSIGTDTGDRSQPDYYWDYTLSENPDAAYGYDVDFNRVPCAQGQERAACLSGAASIAPTNVPEKYQVWDSIDQWTKTSNDLYTLNVNVDNLFDLASFTYAGSTRNYREDSLDNWSRLDASDMFKTWIINRRDSDRDTHQIRLQNLDVKSPLSWTIGAYYDKSYSGRIDDYQNQYHELGDDVSTLMINWWGADATQIGIDSHGNPQNNWNYTNIYSFSREMALFADVAYVMDLGDDQEVELNAGVRRFELEDGSSYQQSGVWANSANEIGGEESGNRFKFSVSYRPMEQMSVYALYSEGYRPGGNNGPLANACANDPLAGNRQDRYTSDSIDNYELGFKANVLDNRLNVAAAVYQIDWTGIKTSVYMDTCGFSYTANGGEAVSRGVEFESTGQLTDDLSVTFNWSHTDSEILEDNPSISATKGDKMTMVPKWNAYLALDHSLQLAGKDAYIRGEMSFYDAYKTHFNVKEEDESPAYTSFNLSGRVELNDTVTISAFLNNVFNKETPTYKRARSRSESTTQQQYINYLQGRTLTLRLDYRFE